MEHSDTKIWYTQEQSGNPPGFPFPEFLSSILNIASLHQLGAEFGER